MLKKKYVVTAILVLCSTATLFLGITTSGTNYSPASNNEYDPWIDLNDDGVIDSTDLGMLGVAWGTSGTPINKTALLLHTRIGITFPDFKYYNVSQVGESYVLEPYPSGGEGYTVLIGQDMAFRVTLTNFDESKNDLKLSSHSALWMLFPTSEQQPRGAWWYIVNVDTNGTIVTPFTTITLPYGVATQVFFASSTDGVFNPSRIKAPIAPNQPAAVNLMLVGEIEDSAYGQNTPFVSVYVEE